jgi:cyclophilin family peptidyl-prolyl cis-trans isomerase
MKVGASTLVFSLAAGLSLFAWAQDKQDSKDSAKKTAPPPAEKTKEKAAEKPADKPAPPADFATVHKQWNDLDKQLNDLSRQYQLAPSSEERAVLRDRYQKLVTQSEKLLPQLRAAADAEFAANPGKDPEVTRILMGMMAYDFRRDDYDAVLSWAKKLWDGKVEDPVVSALAGAAAYLAEDYDTAEQHLAIADKAGKLDAEGKEYLASLSKDKELLTKELAIRAKEKEADDLPRVKFETSKGTIVIELFENEAPQTVGNFVHLVQTKFYDGKTFHRVLPGFMAQGGDPNADGSGGPGYEIPCECYRDDYRRHFRGTLSMAHAGKDTGGSQFFLTFRRTPHLDGKHTAFGRVAEGIDVLPKLQRRNPEAKMPPPPDTILTATVVRKRDHEYQPTKVEKKVEPAKALPEGGKSGKAKGKS